MSAPIFGSWSPAVIGLAGVVIGAVIGFFGNVMTTWIVHRETDRTRFHDVRRELYAKLLAGSQECRAVASTNWTKLAQRNWADIPAEELKPVGDANRQVTGINKSIQLVASSEVCRTAERVERYAIQLSVLGSMREKYSALDESLRQAENTFLEAARAELLPMSAGARLTRLLRRL